MADYEVIGTVRVAVSMTLDAKNKAQAESDAKEFFDNANNYIGACPLVTIGEVLDIEIDDVNEE